MKKDVELADSCQQQQQQQQQGHDQECRPPPHDHHTSCSSSCSLHDHQNDRNFDDLKDLFNERIYGTVKGQYRISMIIEDIESQLATAALAAQQGKQLRQKEEREQKKMQLQNDSRENGFFFFKALDIGGGLGQMTLHFATSGRFRQVDYFDISQEMKTHVDLKITEARERGELQLTSSSSLEQGQEEVSICTRLGGLQDAISISSNNSKTGTSISNRGEELLLPDVVCLHAVLEWLANPMSDLEDLLHYMKNGSILSLLYYNKLSSSSSDGGQNRQQDGPKRKQRTRKCKTPSPLTPYHEFSHDEIEDKLVQCGFEITIRTGLRVKKFHPKTKSNDNDDLIKYLEHERTIARMEPYYWQGRYNHVVAVKIASSKRRE